jgi:hypothetical protein
MGKKKFHSPYCNAFKNMKQMPILYQFSPLMTNVECGIDMYLMWYNLKVALYFLNWWATNSFGGLLNIKI